MHSRTLRHISRTKSAMFLDLDGTIWPDRGPGSILLDESLAMVDIKTILELKRKFDFLIIVTNQTLFSMSKQINQEVLLRYKNKISKFIKSFVLYRSSSHCTIYNYIIQDSIHIVQYTIYIVQYTIPGF